jgi:hypothetical protein
MTKLEELKVAAEAAYAAALAAVADEAAWPASIAAHAAAWNAYYDELEKQRENSND